MLETPFRHFRSLSGGPRMVARKSERHNGWEKPAGTDRAVASLWTKILGKQARKRCPSLAIRMLVSTAHSRQFQRLLQLFMGIGKCSRGRKSNDWTKNRVRREVDEEDFTFGYELSVIDVAVGLSVDTFSSRELVADGLLFLSCSCR